MSLISLPGFPLTIDGLLLVRKDFVTMMKHYNSSNTYEFVFLNICFVIVIFLSVLHISLLMCVILTLTVTKTGDEKKSVTILNKLKNRIKRNRKNNVQTYVNPAFSSEDELDGDIEEYSQNTEPVLQYGVYQR